MWTKRFISTIFLVSMTLFSHLNAANRGIVVACSEKYAPHLYASLRILREVHKCDLPVEIWHSGREITLSSKNKLGAIAGVSFHDIAKIYGGVPISYRGYHIKGFALHASNFNECLLMDADAIFFQTPEVLFEHPKMEENVAYFFRDREDFTFRDYNLSRLEYHDRYFFSSFTYEDRKNFFLHLMPFCTDSVPKDWRHYWERGKEEFVSVTPSEHQDAGCVAIVKDRCPKGIELIKVLNQHHKIFYRYILGDKETFWMSLVASNEPFFVNPTHPYRLRTLKEEREMLHLLDDKLFFMQKSPIPVKDEVVKLIPTGLLSPKRKLTREEVNFLDFIYNSFQGFLDDFNR